MKSLVFVLQKSFFFFAMDQLEVDFYSTLQPLQNKLKLLTKKKKAQAAPKALHVSRIIKNWTSSFKAY